MFSGLYQGTKVNDLKEKVLILGESHHDKNEDTNFTTCSVMCNFYKTPIEHKYEFFHKIAKSFGVEKESIDDEFKKFWDYVYFGNYVEKLCGITDQRAKILISEYREQYNDNLFKFINDNEIKKVFVFSRLVYNNMPSLNKKEGENGKREYTDKIHDKRDWIESCNYKRNCEHKHTKTQLKNDLEVYNMRHPSCRCGFEAGHYKSKLEAIFKGLIKK